MSRFRKSGIRTECNNILFETFKVYIFKNIDPDLELTFSDLLETPLETAQMSHRAYILPSLDELISNHC